LGKGSGNIERSNPSFSQFRELTCQYPLSDSVDFLSKIAKRASVYHDGFHLVHAEELAITDISQFLSPPIPGRHIEGDRIVGARQMAAKLTSLIPSVYLTAIYTAKNEVTVYKGGEEKTISFRTLGA
jgi:hypothetical protein